MENQENIVVETKANKKGIAKIVGAVLTGAAAVIGIKYFLKKRAEKQLMEDLENSEDEEIQETE